MTNITQYAIDNLKQATLQTESVGGFYIILMNIDEY